MDKKKRRMWTVALCIQVFLWILSHYDENVSLAWQSVPFQGKMLKKWTSFKDFLFVCLFPPHAFTGRDPKQVCAYVRVYVCILFCWFWNMSSVETCLEEENISRFVKKKSIKLPDKSRVKCTVTENLWRNWWQRRILLNVYFFAAMRVSGSEQECHCSLTRWRKDCSIDGTSTTSGCLGYRKLITHANEVNGN